MTRPNDPLFDPRIADWLDEDPRRAPSGLLGSVLAAIPSTPQRRASRLPRWFGRGRGVMLLAAGALLLAGGAMAAGSGLVKLPSLVPPQPAPSLPVAVASPTAAPTAAPDSATPSPAPTATPIPVPPRVPSWAATGSMITPRSGFAAVPLSDGKVLVVGGMNGNKALASAELYDPATGAWTATGSMVSHAGAGAGYNHMTATVLGDGKVLVTGGANGSGSLATAELYDPATGTWTATGSMLTPRADHTATLLSDGRVLVAGGQPRSPVASAELYDPATGTWTTTGSMGTIRAEHTATLLSDGRVLVAGGIFDPSPMSSSLLTSAELYDPGTGTWAYAPNMVSGYNGGSAPLLPDGRVLLGGAPPQLYDPGTRSWTATGGKVIAGFDGPDVLLANGGVLALGAAKPGEYNPTRTVAYLFDPGAGSWTAAGKLAVHRYGYTATPLPDGKMLVAGGFDADAANPGAALATAELFDPGTWSPSPIVPATPAPSPTPYAAQPDGSMFAYLQGGRLWVANRDGTGAHELLPDLVGNPGSLAWSSDGTRLVFSMVRDGDPNGVSRLYLTDARGSEPQLVDTGCVAPCTGDTDAAFSRDGNRLVFVRTIGGGPTGLARSSLLATVDLATGHVAELVSTAVDASDYHPRWSPDGTRIVFTQTVPSDVSGTASKWGPFRAVFVVDADGRNFHQIGPAALTADWSPDGARIVFESVSEVDIRWENYDIYTIRPDGSALRRLTSDQGSIDASWTADGRIVFIRARKELANGYVKPVGPRQFWIMDADGGNATQLSVSPKLIGQVMAASGSPFSWPPQP